MFFTSLEPMEENQPTQETPPDLGNGPDLIPQYGISYLLKTEIHFSGNHSGNLRLFLPYELSETLTMNFMGFEEEVTESQILDMACELANMICGNLFSALDKTSIYTLGAPLTQKIPFHDGLEKENPSDLILNFLTDGQPITIQIQFDKSP
jgi:hypothetical protein